MDLPEKLHLAQNYPNRPIRLIDWGADLHYPSFFRVGDRPWTMEQFVTRLARSYPDAAILLPTAIDIPA